MKERGKEERRMGREQKRGKNGKERGSKRERGKKRETRMKQEKGALVRIQGLRESVSLGLHSCSSFLDKESNLP